MRVLLKARLCAAFALLARDCFLCCLPGHSSVVSCPDLTQRAGIDVSGNPGILRRVVRFIAPQASSI